MSEMISLTTDDSNDPYVTIWRHCHVCGVSLGQVTGPRSFLSQPETCHDCVRALKMADKIIDSLRAHLSAVSLPNADRMWPRSWETGKPEDVKP